MIELTSFAVSTDETRYNLNGVYFEPAAVALGRAAGQGLASRGRWGQMGNLGLGRPRADASVGAGCRSLPVRSQPPQRPDGPSARGWSDRRITGADDGW